MGGQRSECGFHGLKETYVVANLDGVVGSRAQRECLREFRHDLDEALFAVFLLKDVFLCAGK